MRNPSKKIVLIMIIVISILLLIGGGILAYTYFCTDAFLTDQKGFYKYVSENFEIMSSIVDDDLLEYMERYESEANSGESEFSIGFSGDINEEQKKLFEEIQKHKITIKGDIDTTNKYMYQDVRLKYQDKDVIGGTFINKGDYLGVMVNDIGLNKFITLENNNLKQFAKNLGMSDEQIVNIPNKIDFESLSNKELFTKEELQEIKDRYLKAITDNLTEDMFSKREENGNNIYSLLITEKKSLVISKALMEALKSDEVIMNKVKQIIIDQMQYNEEKAQELINQLKTGLDQLISELDTTINKPTQTTESNFVIDVYVSDRNLVKTEFIIQEEGKFVINVSDNKITFEIIEINNPSQNNGMSSEFNDGIQSTKEKYETIGSLIIEKNKTDNELSYIISLIDGSNKEQSKISANYTGLNSMTNVGANVEISLNIPISDYNIANVSQNAQRETQSSLEKETITIALAELSLKQYEDTYISEEEFIINETTINESLVAKGLSVTIGRNQDGTFKVQSNTTGNIYTVNSQGVLTNTEIAEIVEPETETKVEDNAEKIINISFNIKETRTFGLVQQQELNEGNLYVINDKTAVELEKLVNQLGDRITQKIGTVYQNSMIGEMVNSNTISNNQGYETDKSVALEEQSKLLFNNKFISYEGDEIEAARVNSLIQTVIISNEAEMTTGNNYIKIKFPSKSGKNQEISVKDNRVTYSDANAENKVASEKKYKVTLKYNEKGIVNEITVKKKK